MPRSTTSLLVSKRIRLTQRVSCFAHQLRIAISGGVRATQFSTETRYDFVTLSGSSRQYTGSGAPLSAGGAPVLDGSTVRFHSDGDRVSSGFEICGTALDCGQHGTSNAEGDACTCEANYFGRAVPEVGRAVCDEGPFPMQYRVSGCADPTNCGV